MNKSVTFSCPRRSGHGFSLIELLVVISIGLILAGLVLAGLSGVWARAKATRQLIGVQQINLLVQIYSADFQDAFPMGSYTNSVMASSHFYEPLIVAGYVPSKDVFEHVWVAGWNGPNMVLSQALACDADVMRPGYTVPDSQRRSQVVRQPQVVYPDKLASVRVVIVRDGTGEVQWCCAIGPPPIGSVGFVDGSCGHYLWGQLAPDGPLYIENGVGLPATTPWGGYRAIERR